MIRYPHAPLQNSDLYGLIRYLPVSCY